MNLQDKQRNPSVPMRRAIFRLALRVLVLLTIFISLVGKRHDAAPGISLTAETWQGVDVGSPLMTGNETPAADGSLAIMGAGAGVYLGFTGNSNPDQGHFTFRQASGDIELVARVRSLSGGPKAQAGLMLRASAADNADIAAVVYQTPAAAGDNPVFVHAQRRPGTPVSPKINSFWTANAPPVAPPFWLKLVRVGKNYATYRSSDGTQWTPVGLYGLGIHSGGAFLTDGSFQAGFFISGGSSGTATAVIDSIYLGPPRLEYRTSWVGNSFNNAADGYASGYIASLYVGLDGRCYTNSFYDEAEEAAKIYQDGRVLYSFTDKRFFGNNEVSEGSVTGDGKYIYIVGRFDDFLNSKVYRTDLDGGNLRWLTFTGPIIGRIGGMAAGNGEIYFSDVVDNRIRVVSASTLVEIPGRSFPFTRPGPMAVDRRGDIWIIQRATDFPNSFNYNIQYPAAVRCYHPDGTFTGKEITDLVNPSALAIDPNQDRLLVCENGPAQNIRIYGLGGVAPSLTGTFGVAGGVFAGPNAGLINDPGNGGYRRLSSPNGVGVDGGGNIYVSCRGIGSDLRKFDPNGNLVWIVTGQPFTDCPDFDPATDGQDLYWNKAHYKLDYTRNAPGSEWIYAGMNWSPFGVDPGIRPNGGAIVRRFGPKNARFMFTIGEKGGDVTIYRFSGEMAIPCGRIGQVRIDGVGDVDFLWVDRNGDGLETVDERTTRQRVLGESQVAFDVNDRGDIYLLKADIHSFDGDQRSTSTESLLRRFRCLGINEYGAPLYSFQPGDFGDQWTPTELGAAIRLRYDAANDVMYLLGNGRGRQPQSPLLARYDHWSQSNRTARYIRALPTPESDTNFIHFPRYPSPEGFQYFAMDVAGDNIFLAELWGPIHVYDTESGNFVTRLLPGPEVSGIMGWTDITMGIRAFRRSNSEYVIVQEVSGYRAVNLMYRWKPSVSNTTPTISAVGVTRTEAAGSSISVIANVSDAEDAENKVSVKVNGGDSATVNGVTVSNITVSAGVINADCSPNGAGCGQGLITIDAAGVVKADIVAACGASDASFTLRVTDSGGLFDEKTLNVTVIPEVQKPVINCPSDISVGTAGTSAIITYVVPSVSDNCSGVGVPVCTPASGSSFPLGVTTVSCSVKDAANNSNSCSFKITVNKVSASFSDPLACAGTGNTVTGTITITNNGNVAANTVATTTLPGGLLALPGTCSASVGTCSVDSASQISYSNSIPAGQTVTITYQAQVGDQVTTGTKLCATTEVSFNGGPKSSVSPCVTVNCPAVGPGLIPDAKSPVSDQKAGSVLIYNLYTSSASSPNAQNTRISLTNIHGALPARVHLFFVDGSNCSVADSYVCLTPNQTTSFIASDLDPGTTGYVVAVAVDALGCPVNFNYLIGDEYVKLESGHAANLGAEAFSAIAGGLPRCDENSATAELKFDGVSYSQAPRVLALSNIPSRVDGNDTLLVLNRVGGNLATGAATLTGIFGIFYDDAETGVSFTFNPRTCQFRSSINNTFPRITPRFESFVPAGRSGWLKLYSTSDQGILGAAINFNRDAASSSGAFNQGHNLHKLTLTSGAVFTIPVFPPSC